MWRSIHTQNFLPWLIISAVIFLFVQFYFDLEAIINILITLNGSTFLMFGYDKFQAGRRSRRVPENVLYLITFLGGSIGTLLGMNIFRHKTRKTSFQFWVILIIIAQVAIAYALWRYGFDLEL